MTSPHLTPSGSAIRVHPRLLLIEPQFMLRRTVALTARSMDLAEVQEVGSFDAARALLLHTPFAAVLMAQTDHSEALQLATEIRAGETACAAQTPLGIMVSNLPRSVIEELQKLAIKHVIIHPARVKTILNTISAMIVLPPKRVAMEPVTT